MPPLPPIALDDYLGLLRLTEVAASPDGTWLAVAAQRLADGKLHSDLWRVPTDGGEARRLTVTDCSDVAPAFRADGSLAFVSDRPTPTDPEPKGRRQVWLLPRDGGEPQPITDEPLGVSSFRLARTCDRLVVLAPVRPGVPRDEQRAHADDEAKNGPSARAYTKTPVRIWDHWRSPAHQHLITWIDGERVDLTPDAAGELREDVWDLAPDGSWVALGWLVDGPERIEDSQLIRLGMGGQRRTLDATPRSAVGSVRISPDSTQVAYCRSDRSPTHIPLDTLWVHDGEQGRRIHWDTWPTLHAWTPGGLLLTRPEGGFTPAYLVDPTSGERTRLTSEAVGGSHGTLSALPDGRVVGLRTRFTHPPEPFVLTPGGDPLLLANLSGWDESGAGVSVEEVRSHVGDVATSSFLLRPEGAQDPLAMVLFIHGGPHGQWDDSWHWRWNALLMARSGYAVLLPNPRGSTGQGVEYTGMLWNNRWADSAPDILAAVDAAAARPGVDGDRVAAMGGSYGGYLANWLMGEPGRFRCFVSHSGVWDFRSMQGGSDFGPWFNQAFSGLAYVDDEAFGAFSPRSRQDRLETPTLVIHGEKDYRCPIHEGLALFEALQERQVPSRLLVFPDEGHWILKPRNIKRWHEEVAAWLARWLEPA